MKFIKPENPMITKLIIAAKSGNAKAMYKLGLYYETGNFVEADQDKAIEWYIKAIKSGNTEAGTKLRNLEKKVIEKLVKNGDIDTIIKLAEYYEEIKDYLTAFSYYEMAAEQGNPTAQFNLGYFYKNGLGVEQDYKKAKEWYEKAAEQGDTFAQNNLGKLYENGLGVEQDYKKAKEWYEKAAEQGNASAQNNLGYLYENGLGVEQDYKKAKEWYEKAAEQENATAQEHLGFLYLFGLGTEINYEIAEKLFRRSFNNGNKSIKYYVDIFDKLKKREIKEIESIADYIGKEIENDLGGILIKPDKNIYDEEAHTLYDIDTFNKIKKQLENMLENIDEVKEDRTNELEVFKQICMIIANNVTYDYNAVDQNNKEYNDKMFTSRNMIGSLLEGKCICAGYAELLRNMCACKGIECIYIRSETHAFNQVKIGGNWYCFDLTNCCDEIKDGIPVENFLLSEKEFKDHFIPLKSQFKYESPYNYNQRTGSPEFWKSAIGTAGTKSVEAAEKYMEEKESPNIS